ncbi:hypothetical protein VI817_005194 [Penicillium citrinum]|nr:hypothetical protein VI817_005194 [Penicillium citrinum]
MTFQGAGPSKTVAQAAWRAPNDELQPRIVAGAVAPKVASNVYLAAAWHIMTIPEHPAWHMQ